jgi:CRISPR/Cas system CMR subunit Cmr4 (Cas7 group RAMP superfamily)
VTARDVRLPVIERKRQDNGQMKDEIKIPLPDFFKDDKSAARVLEWFRQKAEGTEAPKQLTRIQLGGDETTGQGFVALRWII